MPPPPATLTVDLESGVRVTCDVGYLCANSVFPGLSVLDLGPMYATDRQTSDSIIAWGVGHNNRIQLTGTPSSVSYTRLSTAKQQTHRHPVHDQHDS